MEYETMIWICLGFALILTGFFMISGELVWIGIVRVFKNSKPGT
jgi:hypothetical protein